MPVVPTYGSPKVEERPIAGVKQTNVPGPEVFGAGLGDAAERIGTHFATTIADEARQRAHEVSLLDFDRQGADWEETNVHNPETGVLNTVKGRDAYGLPQSVGDAYDKFTGDLIAKLQPAEQLAAQKLAQRRRVDIMGTLDNYASKQGDIYENAVTKDWLEKSVGLAIAKAGAGDVAGVAAELDKQPLIIEGYAQHTHLPSEMKAGMLDEWRTKTHEGVIAELLAQGRDRDAQTYFDRAKDEIDGSRLPGIEKSLEVGSTRGESQRRTDDIMRTAAGETDALDAAKAITDPKLRDAVEERVTHEWALRKQAQRDAAEQSMTAAGNLIDASPREGVRAIPPAAWVQFTPSQKATLEAYAKRNLAADGEGKTDYVKYYGLMRLASENPEKFAASDLTGTFGYLGKTERKQIIELQYSIRKGEMKDANKTLDGFRTNEQIVNDTLDIAGVPRTGTDANPKAVATFRKTLDERVIALEQSTGKKATKVDVQQTADDLLREVTLHKGSWLGILPGIPFRDVTKRAIDVTVADIPTADRTQIEQALRSAGRTVNDAAILNLYLAHQRRIGGLK